MGIDHHVWGNDSARKNIYENGPPNAPFDQEMYLIFNLAVGGTSVMHPDLAYFPDQVPNKPWSTYSAFPQTEFYCARHSWYPSWTEDSENHQVSDDAALQIDSVYVWGFDEVTIFTLGRNPRFSGNDIQSAALEGNLDCDVTSNCTHGTVGTCQQVQSGVCYAKVSPRDECLKPEERCHVSTLFNHDTEADQESDDDDDDDDGRSSTSSIPRRTRRRIESLVFEDEFSQHQSIAGSHKWKHDVTMSGDTPSDFQMYINSRNTSFIQNQTLVIVPQWVTAQPLDHDGACDTDLWGHAFGRECTSNIRNGCLRSCNSTPPISSARLRTAETFSLKYGRIEIRAKLPRGNWLRPTIKLHSLHENYGEGDPSGEVVIVASSGNPISCVGRKGNSIGRNTVSSCARYAPYGHATGANDNTMCDHTERHVFSPTHPKEGFHEHFQTFGLYWSDTEMFTYLNDETNVIARIYDYQTSKSFDNLFDTGAHYGVWNKSTTANPWKRESQKGRRGHSHSKYNDEEEAGNNAPFDQLMYLSIGLSVGGNDGFFPDRMNGKPWMDSQTPEEATQSFLNHRQEWLSTWCGDEKNQNDTNISPHAAFTIDHVRMWAFSDISEWNYHANFMPTESSGIFRPPPASWNTTRSVMEKIKPQALEDVHETLVFEDHFQTLNFSKWKPLVTMNNLNYESGFQTYVNAREIASIDKNQELSILPQVSPMLTGTVDLWASTVASQCTSAEFGGCHREGQDILNPVRSAAFRTAETFSFQYGRMEIHLALPRGDWLWPRISLLPQYPASEGEIILVEGRGNARDYSPVLGYNTIHSGLILPNHTILSSSYTHTPATTRDEPDYHVYGLEWTPDGISIYVDDQQNVIFHQNATSMEHWPFDQELYVQVALAVGGTSTKVFPISPWTSSPRSSSGSPSGTPPQRFWDARSQWLPTWTSALKIRRVSIWARSGQSTTTDHRLVGDRDVFAQGQWVGQPRHYLVERKYAQAGTESKEDEDVTEREQRRISAFRPEPFDASLNLFAISAQIKTSKSLIRRSVFYHEFVVYLEDLILSASSNNSKSCADLVAIWGMEIKHPAVIGATIALSNSQRAHLDDDEDIFFPKAAPHPTFELLAFIPLEKHDSQIRPDNRLFLSDSPRVLMQVLFASVLLLGGLVMVYRVCWRHSRRGYVTIPDVHSYVGC